MPRTLRIGRDAPTQAFVLLPARSLRGHSPLVSTASRNFLIGLNDTLESVPPVTGLGLPSPPSEPLAPGDFRTLDSIAETGAKLIELTSEAANRIKVSQPGLRLVPVRYYSPARVLPPAIAASPAALAAVPPQKMTVKIVDAVTGDGVPGAEVYAFTQFATRSGSFGKTTTKGEVRLTLNGFQPVVERLYITTKRGWWPLLRRDLTLADGIQIPLTPIDPAFTDVVRFLYAGATGPTDGEGVTVGVVDTGVGPHPDLIVAGGMNAVLGEAADDFGDNGDGHGSHVAGIIAAHGGVRGVAPGAALRSYRVFAQGQSNGASSFAIAKAIDAATVDGCDLINISLTTGSPDPTLQTAILDAREQGVVVFCAAGNERRASVSYPASESLAVAVSALGREGLYPANALQWDNVERPPKGTEKEDYIASFSNIGPELDLVGPGDGVISTVPGGYAVMDGTSMACPAAAGRAARLLSQSVALRAMPRDVSRADALISLLLQSAKGRGFGSEFEGFGLLP